MMRSKFRRPWQPQMSDGQFFNPFVRSTDGEAGLGEHHDIEELDEQAQLDADRVRDADAPKHA